MQSRNKKAPTAAEKAHIVRVKLLPCSVCDCGGGEGAPSEAHEQRQGHWWTAIALCAGCHRSSFNGWHGQKRIWLIKKMDELDALGVTIARLFSPQYQPTAQSLRACAAMNLGVD